MLYNEKLSVDAYFGLVKSQIDKKTGNFLTEEMDASSLTLNGKHIIVLCGNNTREPMRASGYAKNCHNWIKGHEGKEDVVVYSIFYKQKQPLLYNFQPDPEVDYPSLTKTIFEQILDKSKSIEDVVKQLSNITFFGHSIGGHVMNELVKNFGKMMKERGFSDSDIAKAYSNMVFIGYSPFALVDAPIKRIYVVPMYDSVGSSKLAYTDLLKNSPILYSNTLFDVQHLYKTKPASYLTFIERYKRALGDAETTYFGGSDYLVAIPNLLYNDGIKEDHNLAGVVDYGAHNPYKTKAGEMTTKFMKDVFTYSVFAPRSEFSIGRLFHSATSQNDNLLKEKN